MLVLTGTVLRVRAGEKKDYLKILNDDNIIEVSADKGKYEKGELVEMQISVGTYQGRTFFSEVSEDERG